MTRHGGPGGVSLFKLVEVYRGYLSDATVAKVTVSFNHHCHACQCQ
jgi:hypothetical protein